VTVVSVASGQCSDRGQCKCSALWRVQQRDGSSELVKSSSWHSKRRRSVTPDEGLERRDRKRTRYDDDGSSTLALCPVVTVIVKIADGTVNCKSELLDKL